MFVYFCRRAAGTYAALLLGFAIACHDAPVPTSPALAPVARAADEMYGCSPQAFICEEGDVQEWYDDGFEEVSAFEVSGPQTDEMQSDAPTSAVGCPSFAVGSGIHTSLSVPTPDGNYQYVTIQTSGTWSWYSDAGVQLAHYNWPSGYWPAVDGSGAEVTIGTALGTCRLFPGGMIAAVSFGSPFRWVNARWPRRRGSAQFTSGGGGGGGGGGTCTQEYVFIEYRDATGWHILWEGWVNLC
jgi:hypothetical protein